MDAAVQVHIYSPLHPPPPPPTALPIPPAAQLPPLIYHLHTPGLSAPSPLLPFLAAHTDLSPSLLLTLLDLGAIYVRAGAPHLCLSSRAVRQEAPAPALPAHKPLYLRVHASPKRHTALSPLRLLQHIPPDVVAVYKPHGLPAVATGDNIADCATTHAAALLQVPSARITTRLDAATGGLLLLARSREGAAATNAMLARSDCTKRYVVGTRARPTEGRVRHWYNKRAPKGRGCVRKALLAPYGAWPGDGWVVAELVVEDVVRKRAWWESVVRLVTGRTHQIRLQFAACGWAVLGDSKYGVVDGAVFEAVQRGSVLGADARAVALHAWCVEGELYGQRVRLVSERTEDWRLVVEEALHEGQQVEGQEGAQEEVTVGLLARK